MRGKAIDEAPRPLMSPETGPSTIHGTIAAGNWRGFDLPPPSSRANRRNRGISQGTTMKTTTTYALIAGALLVGQPVLAEADSETSIDQIIVTGARTPMDALRTGSAYTVISRDEIERRQARYVSDLLRSVPGMAVSHTGVIGAQTQVRVRGSEANHILVLIDGVPQNDPATGDEFRWEHLSAANVERVEIVRGPQSALWGSDAIGGVVNVITQTGSASSGANVYAESGANSTLNIGADGRMISGDWLLSAGFDSLDTDGENISRTGSEDDGADLTTASLAAHFGNPQDFEFRAGLRLTDATSQTDPTDFFVTGLPTDGDQETRSDNLSGNIGVAFGAHNDRVTYSIRADYFDSDHRNFVDGTEGSSTASQRLGFGVQSDIQLGSNLLSLALEHEDTEFEQRGAVVFGDPNQDQDMQVDSVVAEYQHNSGDRLTWILGARFDSHSDFDDAFTGKASIAYELSDVTVLRASVGTGFKTPTFTERYGFFPATFVGNPDLKPETSKSYEIGIGREFADGAFHVQASIYAQQLEDEINGFVFDPVTFLATAENRDGTSDRSGFELSADWLIGGGFGMAASYTYTDAEEEDATGQNVTELRRPRHSGSVSFDFTNDNNRFQAFLAAEYGGTRDDIFFPPFPNPSEIISLNNYWLVDASVQYQMTEAITVFARGTNLLDEDYEQVYGFNTPGIAGYVGLRASFGR